MFRGEGVGRELGLQARDRGLRLGDAAFRFGYVNPRAIPEIWHWALGGAAVLMLSKIVIVAWIVRASGMDSLTGWRTGLLLAVGGETLEAALMIASQALLLMNVPQARVLRRMQEQRATRYRVLREHVRGDAPVETDAELHAERAHPIVLPPGSPAVGRVLDQLPLDGVVVTALVRGGERRLSPPSDTCLEAGDAVVLFGRPDDLQRAERELLG